jgi:carbonic anhydrase/acetyltransferase-like protein (isoleucine patch superfamily)
MSAIRPYRQFRPQIARSAYVDPQACVIGRVTMAADASIWPFAVARGDVHEISIGARSNIQDGSVLHVTHDGRYSPGGRALVVGDDVTVGHGVILHACTIGDGCLIGMGSSVLDDVEIGHHAMIGAGSLIPPGKRVQPGALWLGNPAKFVRYLNDEEIEKLLYSAAHYVRIKNDYLDWAPAEPAPRYGDEDRLND